MLKLKKKKYFLDSFINDLIGLESMREEVPFFTWRIIFHNPDSLSGVRIRFAWKIIKIKSQGKKYY